MTNQSLSCSKTPLSRPEMPDLFSPALPKCFLFPNLIQHSMCNQLIIFQLSKFELFGPFLWHRQSSRRFSNTYHGAAKLAPTYKPSKFKFRHILAIGEAILDTIKALHFFLDRDCIGIQFLKATMPAFSITLHIFFRTIFAACCGPIK